MTREIRRLRVSHDDDRESLVRLSLRAWEPVFAPFAAILGPC